MASSEAQGWTNHHRTQLPGWTRPALCRIGGVKTLSRDKLPPGGSQMPMMSVRAVGGERGGTEVDVHQKMLQLEKNMAFLCQQHRDTLQQLHWEIERLKKDNRDLNFRLIMCRCGRAAGGGKQHTASVRRRRGRLQSSISGEETDPGTPNDELHVFLLEEEVRDLRNALASEKNKNARLMRVIEQKVLEQQKSTDQSDVESSMGVSPLHMPLVRGAHPVVVGESRPPTLEECESIIRHLQYTNDQQSHELIQIKADLHDVLYSHKWTPDAYIMARAYISDEKSGKEKEGLLPKIAAQSNRRMTERAYQCVNEGVTLPALHPRMPNSVAERLKRAQALRGRTGQ